MIAIICAIMAGVTIVLSRTVNGYLGQRIGVYQVHSLIISRDCY